MKKLPKKIMIAGPCAVENDKQVSLSIQQAKDHEVDFIRLSLWKPRTKPGFEGVGEAGIRYLVEAAKQGLNPGFEPLLPEHIQMVAEAVLPATKTGKLLAWIGARNQNHYIQREMARIASQSDRITLMVKNQVWHNEKHWEGIIEHVLSGGIKKENLVVCHRGFAPYSNNNPNGYRNVPDYDMAMRIKERYDVAMVFDPSHTGGTVEKVFQIAQEANTHAFDGYIIEVHPNPKEAQSDANQQLNWNQYKELIKTLYDQRVFMAKKQKIVI